MALPRSVGRIWLQGPPLSIQVIIDWWQILRLEVTQPRFSETELMDRPRKRTEYKKVAERPGKRPQSATASTGKSGEAKVWIKRFGKNAGKPSGRAGRVQSDNDLPEGVVRLYGMHVVRAALDNPARHKIAMTATRNALIRLEIAAPETSPFPITVVEPRALDDLLGKDAVHQGVALEARTLKTRPLKALAEAPLILVLDQVTDPHNVGALMRSAVAFGVSVFITTMRHSPEETGVMAKAASGALEHIEHITVRNLGEAIEALNDQGYQTIGLDSEGPAVLEQTLKGSKVALVLGAEGKGLRQKTRNLTSDLARLDMPGAIRSLNVSNAGAIALYLARRHLG
jgi:23S rRNA (guanosine2251-2'-O)-methyltransferase